MTSVVFSDNRRRRGIGRVGGVNYAHIYMKMQTSSPHHYGSKYKTHQYYSPENHLIIVTLIFGWISNRLGMFACWLSSASSSSLWMAVGNSTSIQLHMIFITIFILLSSKFWQSILPFSMVRFLFQNPWIVHVSSWDRIPGIWIHWLPDIFPKSVAS